ncbi:hypothetical protein GMB86_08565 [Terrilactibacillus sp. BCM23-1]|uniref:Uncharacterized protein n=1 Tax=Terrilactibacillus tamarindi TaxID=2599694 RepID=A0A6N8CPG4_9BACI|nr:hypothetical protein [Terrilactibacillus tamarindi]MTT32059.1 hypothetical protein [Terrilactibacillus tamarindi]
MYSIVFQSVFTITQLIKEQAGSNMDSVFFYVSNMPLNPLSDKDSRGKRVTNEEQRFTAYSV